MKYSLLATLFFAVLAGCSENKLPGDVLPKQKMQAVMWDMIRADEFLNGFVLIKSPSADRLQETQKWYDKVYAMHKISKAQFDKSYKYYKRHPVIMRELMDSLAKKLPGTDTPAIDSMRRTGKDTIARPRLGLPLNKAVTDSMKAHRKLQKAERVALPVE